VREKANKSRANNADIAMLTVVKNNVLVISLFKINRCRQFCYKGDTEKIHRCFERVNQLLSLLLPVSDINRIALERGGGIVACSTLTGNSHPVFR